jgi:hypothetical protein
VDTIAGLDVLQLFILVAVLRLHRRGHGAPNFELAWAEYAKTGGMQHADIYGRPAAARAFQRLLDAGLLAPADARCAAALPLHACLPAYLCPLEARLLAGGAQPRSPCIHACMPALMCSLFLDQLT